MSASMFFVEEVQKESCQFDFGLNLHIIIVTKNIILTKVGHFSACLQGCLYVIEKSTFEVQMNSISSYQFQIVKDKNKQLINLHRKKLISSNNS